MVRLYPVSTAFNLNSTSLSADGSGAVPDDARPFSWGTFGRCRRTFGSISGGAVCNKSSADIFRVPTCSCPRSCVYSCLPACC